MKKIILGLAVGVSLFFSSCSKEYKYAFENGYNKGDYQDTVQGEIDTSRSKIDYSKYPQARLFPGLVGDKEPRLENHLVQIDLDYEEIRSSDLRISVAPGAWQSTSMYAPAGELIMIDVPMGVYGLTAQIGAHTATSVKPEVIPQRDLRIFTSNVLFPGKNYLRNPYGGLIYIIPSRPLGRVIDLHFSGAVKAPSFRLGKMTNEEWKALVEKSTVPWFELEGKRIIFTVQKEKLKRLPIEDPTLLMETWDRSIREAYWDWTGMTEGNPDVRHRAPFNKWRIVHEVLLDPGVAAVSGYPVRAINNDGGFRQLSSIQGVREHSWGYYHELGHNMQMGSTWNFNGNGEITNNIFHFKVSMIYGKQSYKIKEVVERGGLEYAKENKRKSGNMNWIGMDEVGNKYKSSAHDVRLMMYAQIFEKYGYEFMTYIYKRARNARFTSANDQSKVDFFYEALSEYTNTDMLPFLERGWGIYPSNVSKRIISQDKALPMLDKAVWLFNPYTKTGGDGPIPPLNPRDYWKVSTDAGEYGSGYKIGNIIDGNSTTIWHSKSGGAPFPFYILVESEEEMETNGFLFQGRSGYSSRYITNYELQIRANANAAWETVPMEFGNSLSVMNGKDSAVPVKFADGKLRKFMQFKLIVKSATNADVAMAELNILPN